MLSATHPQSSAPASYKKVLGTHPVSTFRFRWMLGNRFPNADIILKMSAPVEKGIANGKQNESTPQQRDYSSHDGAYDGAYDGMSSSSIVVSR